MTKFIKRLTILAKDSGAEIPSGDSVSAIEKAPAGEVIDMNTLGQVEDTAISIVTEQSLADAISQPQAFLHSYPKDGTRATGLQIYNAINNTTGNLGDLEKPKVFVNMVAHKVDLLNDETGEIENVIRIVLVTEDGESYGSVATGILSSIQKIVNIPGIGPAPWTPGLTIKGRKVKTRNSFTTNTLELME
jgi:hypothetical protein